MNEYGKKVAKKMEDYMGDPDSIDEEIRDIQNAKKGYEVRGALGSGVSKSHKTSKDAIEVTNHLLDESFDKGALNTNIEKRLRDLEENYAPELFTVKDIVETVFRTIDETSIGVDIQGIDRNSLKSRGERLPVDIGNREVVVEEIVSRSAIRDREKVQVSFPQTELKKFKEFDFFIINNLDSDVRISFAVDPGYGYSSLMTSDGEALLYRTSDEYLHHRVPADSRNIRLSDIPAQTTDGKRVAVNKKPFGDLYLKEFLYIEYRASSVPTSGDLTIQFVGVPI